MDKKLPITDEISAIIPCYTATGDTTIIITSNGGRHLFKTHIRTIIKRLARAHCIDLVALKQKAMRITTHALLQPLPIAPGLVLCPIKLRIPRVQGDTSTGYVNLYTILNVITSQNKPFQSVIKLKDGTELPSIWQPSSVKKHLQYAQLVLSSTPIFQLPAELALISHSFTELCNALLSIQSLHHTLDHDFTTILT